MLKSSCATEFPLATFVRAHARSIAAADFFTTEVWTAHGLIRYYTLFVIDLKTRVVEIAGSTPNPDSAWMTQITRDISDPINGFLKANSGAGFHHHRHGNTLTIEIIGDNQKAMAFFRQ